jgi:hypothetical protein
VAVHTNGLGSLLLAWRYSSIAAIRSGTDLKTPRRMAFVEDHVDLESLGEVPPV